MKYQDAQRLRFPNTTVLLFAADQEKGKSKISHKMRKTALPLALYRKPKLAAIVLATTFRCVSKQQRMHENALHATREQQGKRNEKQKRAGGGLVLLTPRTLKLQHASERTGAQKTQHPLVKTHTHDTERQQDAALMDIQVLAVTQNPERPATTSFSTVFMTKPTAGYIETGVCTFARRRDDKEGETSPV